MNYSGGGEYYKLSRMPIKTVGCIEDNIRRGSNKNSHSSEPLVVALPVLI